jgi:L-alanine-DL-glutamate epimerase-like enolase superfamily enzyme
MKITGVTCHVLLDPGFEIEATDSAQDDIVVEVHTDEGLTGIGETDLNAWVAQALIEAPGTNSMDRGLRDTLLGVDPLDPVAAWESLYVATAMTGRRGAGVHALGALDMALWDIRGKAAGVPVWKLLSSADTPERLVPYASLLPRSNNADELIPNLVRDVRAAADSGFKAAKLELLIGGPYGHREFGSDPALMTRAVEEVRGAVGPDFTLMVDVGYAWASPSEALAVLDGWADLDVFFIETPLWSDDLDGMKKLVERSPVPVAAGEWLATRFEFEELLERTGLQVLQPDIGRVGGITEADRVCDLAGRSDRRIVPHGWKTGITVAATAQLAAARPEVQLFEFLPSEQAKSRLRRELVNDEVQLGEEGTLSPPERPGLGIELNRDALEVMREAAEAHVRDRRATAAATHDGGP